MTFRKVTHHTQRRERLLLLLATSFLALTALTLAIAQRDFWSPAGLWSVWLGAAWGGHSALNRWRGRRDPLLYPVTMLLAGWGLLLIWRLLPAFAWRQAVWIVVGVVAMLAVSTLPKHLRWLRRYRYTWLVGGILLLLVTIWLGVNPSGAGPRLWLGVAGVYFQPSELLKMLLVVFLASYLADYRSVIRDERFSRPGQARWSREQWLPALRALGPLLLMWGISALVTIWQQDLGTATIFFVIFLTMLYIASGRSLYVLTGLLLLLLAAVVAYRLFAVVQLRIDIWLNPWPEASDRAYQIVQSLLAFATGGVGGTGAGLGSPGYIPVVHSDFIFAAIGEEWGLIGALSVLACLTVLVMRGLQLAALWAEIHFRMLLAAGLSVLLAAQSILIMGGVLKLIPLTGVTLPFMSYGGSSLLMNFVLVGLFLLLSSPPVEVRAGVSVRDTQEMKLG